MSTRRMLIPLVIAISIAMIGDVALAWFKNFAPFQDGFSHQSVSEYSPDLTPIPGVTTDKKPGDPAAGLELEAGKRITYSSPVLANLDDDSKTLEIAVGTDDGFLNVYNSKGSKLWTANVVNDPACPAPVDDADVSNGGALIFTAPAVGDVNGDGSVDVVVGYGPININGRRAACKGGIAAYSRDGNLINRFVMPNPEVDNQGAGSAVLASPSIVDLNGKGDIIVAAGSNNLFFWVVDFKNLYQGKPTVRWRYNSKDTHFSSPSFADLDGDGTREIVVGTDFSPGQVCDPTNAGQIPPKANLRETGRGFVNVFAGNALTGVAFDKVCERDGDNLFPDGTPGRDTDGDNRPNEADGVPDTIGFGKGFMARARLDQAIYSSPAIADLQGDGNLDIIVGASCFYGPNRADTAGNSAPGGRWIKIFNYQPGNKELVTVRTIETPRCIVASPAIGDVNGDGNLDIVAFVPKGNPGDTAPDPTVGQVMAWNADGSQIWSQLVTPKSVDGQSEFLSEWTNNPVLADLDGNGSVEVLVVLQNSLVILNGADGKQLTTDQVNCRPQDLRDVNPNCRLRSLLMWHSVRNTPAVGDIDGDGDLEVVAAGGFNNADNAALTAKRPAMLYVWTDFSTYLASSTPPAGTAAEKYARPWPMFKRDAARTGVLLARRLTAGGSTNPAVTLTLGRGTSQQFQLAVNSPDGSTLNWTATEDDPNNLLTLNRAAGNQTQPLDFTVTAPPLVSPGIQQTQVLTAAISLTAEGLGQITIPVNLTAGDFKYVYVPAVGR